MNMASETSWLGLTAVHTEGEFVGLVDAVPSSATNNADRLYRISYIQRILHVSCVAMYSVVLTVSLHQLVNKII